MIAFLFTPIGRYLAIAAILAAVLGGAYLKIRSDAVAELEAKSTADQLERNNDAIRAGDSVDVKPDRLRDADKYSRD